MLKKILFHLKSEGIRFGIYSVIATVIAALGWITASPFGILLTFVIADVLLSDFLDRKIEYNKLSKSNDPNCNFNADYYELYWNNHSRNLKLMIGIWFLLFSLIYEIGDGSMKKFWDFTFWAFAGSCFFGVIFGAIIGNLGRKNNIVWHIIARRRQDFSSDFTVKDMADIAELGR